MPFLCQGEEGIWSDSCCSCLDWFLDHVHLCLVQLFKRAFKGKFVFKGTVSFKGLPLLQAFLCNGGREVSGFFDHADYVMPCQCGSHSPFPCLHM